MTCAFEPTNNRLLASGGLDNLCSVYKISEDGKADTRAAKELAGHDGYLSCCRFVNGGKELLTSSGDSTCFLWDIERQEIMQKFEDHTGDVMSISISPENEKIFASGSCDTCVKVWDMREKSNHSHTFGGDGDGDDDVAYGHESDINSIDFMGNGYSIASGSDDSTCKLFDMRSYCCIANYEDQDKFTQGITSVALSKGGRVLFAGYDDHYCVAWDIFSGEHNPNRMEHENRVSCLGVSQDGNALCTGSWDQVLKIWA